MLNVKTGRKGKISTVRKLAVELYAIQLYAISAMYGLHTKVKLCALRTDAIFGKHEPVIWFHLAYSCGQINTQCGINYFLTFARFNLFLVNLWMVFKVQMLCQNRNRDHQCIMNVFTVVKNCHG